MNMPTKYVSIDLETTSLDARQGKIIEFAAVIDDLKRPVDELPVFRRLIVPRGSPVFYGTPFALAMNAQILYEIDAEIKQPSERSCFIQDLPKLFREWLDIQGFGYERPAIAGKNFGKFDTQFLLNESSFFEVVRPHHRVIDPGNLYWDFAQDGFLLPDTATCMKRAGLDPTVKHRATEDARVVCRLIRHKLGVAV